MTYELLKWLHIVSATLLFGTGLGSAFYKFNADRCGNIAAIYQVNKTVVVADWLFTAPTVVLQPLSGWALAHLAGYSMATPWLLVSLLLFSVAGLCWLPVVWLQIRMRDMAWRALQQQTTLGADFWRLARYWFWLGVPAFLAIIGVLVLMVFKPGI